MTANVLCAVLPIQLLSFTATSTEKNQVRLDWSTATEMNNDFFTIERTKDGVNWEVLSTVDGGGNSSDLLVYSFLDVKPYLGESYYRLKQTDFNGEFEYSDVRYVNLEKADNDKIELYPNPTKNQITLEGDSFELEVISISNVKGQKFDDQIVISKSEKSKVVIDLSNLEKGVYIIKTRTKSHKVYRE